METWTSCIHFLYNKIYFLKAYSYIPKGKVRKKITSYYKEAQSEEVWPCTYSEVVSLGVIWCFWLTMNNGSRMLQGMRETQRPSLERIRELTVEDWMMVISIGQFLIQVITFCVSKSSLNVQLGMLSLNVILSTP